MKNISKKAIVLYAVILGMCLVICAPLLQMHIASDTYNFMDLGYFEYPSQFFLKDARFVSSIVAYMAGFLHMSYPVFIVLMEVLAVIIAAFSIYLLYKTIIEKISKDDQDAYKINLKNVLIIMGVMLVIFNCMSLEYFLYAENAVMCLSVFLCILAARIFTKETTHKFIKTLCLVCLATFCYQGCVNIFVTLVLLFLVIDKNKIDAKEIFKRLFVAGIIFGISFFINVIAIYVSNIMLETSQGRVAGGIAVLSNIMRIVPIIVGVFEIVLIDNFGLWPTWVILIFVAITLLLLAYMKDSKETVALLVKYISLILVAILTTVIPIFFMKSPSIEPRMSMSIGAIIGLSLIYLNVVDTNNAKVISNIIMILTIGFFMFNTINTIHIFTAHIATNKVDDNMGLTVKYKIESYEKETGNVVTKVAFYRDASNRNFIYGYNKKYSSFTQRGFANYYCILETLNYYCGRKFEKTLMDKKIYEENFAGKDWDAYSDEQIVFVGDTMYMCTY